MILHDPSNYSKKPTKPPFLSIFVFIFITFKIIQMKIRNLNKHKEAVKNYADLIIDTVENLAATTKGILQKPIQ